MHKMNLNTSLSKADSVRNSSYQNTFRNDKTFDDLQIKYHKESNLI